MVPVVLGFRGPRPRDLPKISRVRETPRCFAAGVRWGPVFFRGDRWIFGGFRGVFWRVRGWNLGSKGRDLKLGAWLVGNEEGTLAE